MRLLYVIAVIGLCIDGPLAAAVEVPNSLGHPTAQRGSGDVLLADCSDRPVRVEPLSPRPAVRRHVARPRKRIHRAVHKHRPRHHIVKRHVVKRRHVAHRPVHRRRPVVHRPLPVAARPVVSRATYASPLCGARTASINHMLGLDALPGPITESPYVPVASEVPIDTPPVFTTPGPETTVTGPPPSGGDIFPGGPVIVTPGTPVGPGTPTTPTTPVPETATWAMMLAGMGLVGGALRRRRRTAAPRRVRG